MKKSRDVNHFWRHCTWILLVHILRFEYYKDHLFYLCHEDTLTSLNENGIDTVHSTIVPMFKCSYFGGNTCNPTVCIVTVPMVFVAVRRRSSLGQSRKERLALVPEGTVIFSWTTESFLISQWESEPIFSMWRNGPSSSDRFTVQRTDQGIQDKHAQSSWEIGHWSPLN